MLIQVFRIANGNDSTLGMLRLDGNFECWTLEDEYRETKVKNETRIPAGRYEIKYRIDPSPMRDRYREKFDWFDNHLQIQNVKDFDYIYIHSGNTDDHTSGCLLVGYSSHKSDIGEYTISRSVDAFRALYAKIGLAIKAGEKVYIEISSF